MPHQSGNRNDDLNENVVPVVAVGVPSAQFPIFIECVESAFLPGPGGVSPLYLDEPPPYSNRAPKRDAIIFQNG